MILMDRWPAENLDAQPNSQLLPSSRTQLTYDACCNDFALDVNQLFSTFETQPVTKSSSPEHFENAVDLTKSCVYDQVCLVEE